MFNRHRHSKRINFITTKRNPVQYAKELVGAMGPAEALRVANNTYSCAKNVVENLAVAPTFVDPKTARRDLGFWTTVYGYLAKRQKPSDKKGVSNAKASK